MKIIECPRDAMQGLSHFVPTEAKVRYINKILKVGFDTVDFGSFVSPKVIPQMADTWKVVQRLDLSGTDTKLLAIVANLRGAHMACGYEQIDYLGFPFSVSETFQLRNANATLSKSFADVQEIFNLCQQHDKELVIYISMGFGNPYGELWHPAIVEHWVDRFISMGIQIISLSDTVGIATPQTITDLFQTLTIDYPGIEFGAHLHTEAHNWREKIEAAYFNGCRRFDGAIKGFGGCPMAQNALVGNMPTENITAFFQEERADFFIDKSAFLEAQAEAINIFHN